MKIQKSIKTETLRLAAGLLAADVLVCVVFLLCHAFDYTVVLGALFGSAVAVGNFFLLGVTMQRAADRDSGQKKAVQLSYTLRMLMIAAAIVLGYLIPFFQLYAVLAPIVLATPVLLIMQAIAKKREGR